MSVKVAVRVRPFNAREKELNSQLCVEMAGVTTTITNPEDNKTKNFAFDFSFWSHDGFETDEKGYFVAVDPKYADQQHVYDLVGKEVLDNAWEGYHCCLFAYGQTGAGKSYSMVGYGANKGIVPISMQQIFERIAQNSNEDVSFEVCFSMLEIYNEKIQDLLIPVKDRVQEGLKVREHQKYGVYVDGLSRHPVDSYEAIEAKMDEGSKNRTIGSTLMNASSSRAHTIMTIEFKKIEVINGKKTEKFAVINLVDLAGSEKISKTGAAGDRLKEGCAINKSLSTLGLVISKLADKALGKKSVVVPYRDSALTRILQNALGGNSKTLMICALSPATDNYEETLSTLRYADQAKKIKNNAVINESEQDKMIRELREENEKLKSMLKDFNPNANVGEARVQMIDEETLRKFKEMEEQLKANAFMMQQYDKTFEEKLAEAKAKETSHETDVDTTQPYLMNLNEDPLLSGKVLHSLAKEKILIGKKNANPSPDIVLGGIGIKTKHAEIINKDSKITLIPCDKECGERLYVNGQKVYESVDLAHNDRIIIGTNTTFLVKYPGKEDESPNANKVNETDLDWEFAQTELVDTLNKETKIKLDDGDKNREKEVEEKIKLIEEKFQKEKQANDDVLSQQKEEYERKLQELEEKMKRETEKQKIEMEKVEAEREWNEQIARYEADLLMKEKERERMQKAIQEEATLQRFKEQEKVHLEHKLAKHLSQITEVNLIAKELKRDVTFSVRLTYNFVTGSELSFYEKPTKTKIQIFVQNKETNNQYTWPMSKFTNRYFIIRDLLEQHYEGNKLPDKNTSEDPFWDPPEAHLVGQGFITLESLAYLMDNPAELHLVNDNGTIGKLNVNILPIDENGEPFNEDDNLLEDPSELMGKKLDFLIIIDDAELDETKCQDTYCEYSFMKDDLTFETFQTPIVKGVHSKPEYKYKGHHSFAVVNDKILNYLLNHNLKLQVFGSNIAEEKPTTKENKKGSDTSSPNTKSFKARNKNLQIATDSDDEAANKKPQAQALAPQIIYQQSYQAGVSMTPMNMGNRQEIEDLPVRRQTAGKAMEMLKATNQANNAGKGKEAPKQGKEKDKDCNMF